MKLRCRCGAPVPHDFDQLGCIECSQPCCPTCGYCLESVWYCPSCAGALLEPLENAPVKQRWP